MNVGDTFDVDGYIDARGIEYKGKATLQRNGKWHCLAIVGQALCIVEVGITFGNKESMAKRVIHSCDWCGVDSKVPGFVGEGWQILKNDGSEWICVDCSKARTEALERVKLVRQGKIHKGP